MPDVKISALTAATSFLDADEFPVNEAGVSKKVTGTVLKAWAGNVLVNQSTADQSPTVATLTYLTGSNISIPTGKLRVGSWFHWHLQYSKTAAGTAARSHHIRLGTAGTTADTAIITLTPTPVPAAVADNAWSDIYCICRGPLSASCILTADMSSVSSRNGLFGATGKDAIQVTSGVVDVTVANLIIGLSVLGGAAEALTYQLVTAEARGL